MAHAHPSLPYLMLEHVVYTKVSPTFHIIHHISSVKPPSHVDYICIFEMGSVSPFRTKMSIIVTGLPSHKDKPPLALDDHLPTILNAQEAEATGDRRGPKALSQFFVNSQSPGTIRADKHFGPCRPDPCPHLLSIWVRIERGLGRLRKAAFRI